MLYLQPKGLGDMDKNVIEFVTFCINSLARKLNMSKPEVYNKLKASDILYGYIVPSYDVLHTFSLDYLMEDLIDLMKKRGALDV